MTDEQENQADRSPQVERLLRRWGAEESARQVRIPKAPRTNADRRAGRISTLARWLPAAVAAGLLIAAGVVYLAAPSGANKTSRANPDAARVAKLEKTIADLKARQAGEMKNLREQLAAVEKAKTEAQNKYAASAGEVAALRIKLQEASHGDPEKLAEVRRKLGEKLRAARAQLDVARDKLKATEGELLAARRKLTDAAESTAHSSRRLSAALKELASLRKMNDDAIAARRKAMVELHTIRARHKVMQAEFQRMYFEIVAAGESGMSARKKAARRGRMLERLAKLRSQVASERVRKVLDRLEVVLTQLDMTDPYDRQATEILAGLVRKGKLASQIDEVLATGGTQGELRGWLIEAKLIFMGAERVG